MRKKLFFITYFIVTPLFSAPQEEPHPSAEPQASTASWHPFSGPTIFETSPNSAMKPVEPKPVGTPEGNRTLNPKAAVFKPFGGLPVKPSN